GHLAARLHDPAGVPGPVGAADQVAAGAVRGPYGSRPGPCPSFLALQLGANRRSARRDSRRHDFGTRARQGCERGGGMNITLLIVAMAVVSLAERASFLLLNDRLRPPPMLEKALKYVPAAVLAA